MPHVCLLIPVLFALAFQQANSFETLWAEGKEQLKRAQYAQAETTLRAAVREGSNAGNDEMLLALAMNDLAQASSRTGNQTEAESLYNQAIAILRKRSEPWRLAVVLNNQARLYRELGMDLRSAASFKEAHTIAKTARFENTPVVAAALSGLADARSAEGDLRGAERYLRQALRIRATTLGAEHLDVAETLNNLGVIHTRMKQYEQAEAAFRRALKISQTSFGTSHPDVAAILDNLGVLHYEREQYSEAEKLLRQALDIRQKQVLPDHSALARNLTHLAHLMIRVQRPSEAEELLREALTIRGKVRSGVDHELALILESYALALRLNGRAADALAVDAQASFLRAKLKYVVRR